MDSKFYKIMFLGFFLPLISLGQIDVSSIHKIGEINLKNRTEVYIDLSASQSITEVVNQKFEPLTNIELPSIAVQNYRKHYWLKFQLENSTADTLYLVFTAGYHFEQNLYANGQKRHTDMSLKRNERPVYFDDKYLPITLFPYSKQVFYAELINLVEKSFAIEPKLLTQTFSEHKKLQSFYSDSYPLSVNYALNAILFFMGLFVFLQYCFSKQRYFLYYAFYLFSMWFFSTWGFSHSPFVSSIMNHVPFLKFTLRQNFYVLTTQYCYFLFLVEFLEIHQKYPKIDRFLVVFRGIIFYFILFELFFTLIYRRLDFEIYLMVVSQVVLSIGGLVANLLILRIKGTATNFIKVGSVSLLLASVFGFITIYFKIFPESTDLLPHYPNIYFNYFVIFEILCFSLGIGYKFLESIQEKALWQREASQAELNALRLQINPHFIFNSLNSIKSYILKEKTKEAAQYLTDFSQLFRAVLEQSREPIISLQQEIETLLLYIKLEQKRLKHQFEFRLNVQEELDTDAINIPSLLLQPFVENAIKHGLSNQKNGLLQVSFSADSELLVCEISDNGPGIEATKSKKTSDNHQSLGTKIIEERLRLLNNTYQWPIMFTVSDLGSQGSNNGTVVTIKIPIH